jgi:hypothetical protein
MYKQEPGAVLYDTSGDAARFRTDKPQTRMSSGGIRLVAIGLIDHEQLVEALVGQYRLDATQCVIRTIPGRESHRNSKSTLVRIQRATLVGARTIALIIERRR